MKRKNLVLVVLLSVFVSACATKVQRVERDRMIDISGEWNDYDAMIVSQEFVSSALKSPWLDSFIKEYSRNPIVIVGQISNRSSEHINTQVFVKYLERELMNSGRVIFVASPTEREGIREEREDMQQGNTDPETIKAIGREKGADFMFIGSVNSVEDSERNRSAVLYQANMELIDLETNVKVWLGQKDIKKVVTKPRFSL